MADLGGAPTAALLRAAGAGLWGGGLQSLAGEDIPLGLLGVVGEDPAVPTHI